MIVVMQRMGSQFNTVSTQLQPQKTLMNRGEVTTCDMSACTRVGIPLVLLRCFTPDVTHQNLICFCLKWHICVPFVAHFVQRTHKIKEAVSCRVVFCCICGAYSQQSNSKTAVHMAKYSRSIYTYKCARRLLLWLTGSHCPTEPQCLPSSTHDWPQDSLPHLPQSVHNAKCVCECSHSKDCDGNKDRCCSQSGYLQQWYCTSIVTASPCGWAQNTNDNLSKVKLPSWSELVY